MAGLGHGPGNLFDRQESEWLRTHSDGVVLKQSCSRCITTQSVCVSHSLMVTGSAHVTSHDITPPSRQGSPVVQTHTAHSEQEAVAAQSSLSCSDALSVSLFVTSFALSRLSLTPRSPLHVCWRRLHLTLLLAPLAPHFAHERLHACKRRTFERLHAHRAQAGCLIPTRRGTVHTAEHRRRHRRYPNQARRCVRTSAMRSGNLIGRIVLNLDQLPIRGRAVAILAGFALNDAIHDFGAGRRTVCNCNY